VKERTGNKFEEAAASISGVFENMRGLDQGTENSETTDSDEDDPGLSSANDKPSKKETGINRKRYQLSKAEQEKIRLRQLEKNWGRHNPYVRARRDRIQKKSAIQKSDS
jgi:hypothetical protein